jgi:hypothetical protein
MSFSIWTGPLHAAWDPLSLSGMGKTADENSFVVGIVVTAVKTKNDIFRIIYDNNLFQDPFVY